MKRPFLIYAVFLILGIVFGDNLKIFLLILTSTLIYSIYVFSCEKKFFIFTVIPVLCLGFLLSSQGLKPKSLEIDQIAKEEKNVAVSGEIIKILNKQNKNSKILLMVDSLYSENKVFKTKLKITVSFDETKNIKIGDNILLTGKLKNFSSPRNEGSFNEKLYMKTRKYDYKIYSENLSFLCNKKESIYIKILKLREKASNIYDKILPNNEAQIAKSLIFGEKNDLDDTISEKYKKTGIFHILAISGLHINIACFLIFFVLKSLGLNKRKSSLIAVFIILIYLPFTGFMVSALRASIMSIVFLSANIFKRENDSYNSLGIAAFILLIYQSLYVYDSGFILSFLVSLGVISMGKKTSGLGRVKKLFVISFASNCVSLPLLAYFYTDFTVWGIIANCLVLPIIPFLIGMCFISCIMGLFCLPLGRFFAGSVYVILKYIQILTDFFSSLPLSSFSVGKFSHIIVILYFLILFMIYHFEKHKRIYFLGIISCLFSTMFLIFSNRIFYKNNEIIFFDVGQGDSALVKTFDGHSFLIDGGGNYFQELGENTGKNIIIPYLERNNIKKLDIMFISHMDIDHALGGLEVLKEYDVDKIVISDKDFSENEIYKSLLSIAKEKNSEILRLSEGDYISVGDSSEFSVLYPFESYLDSKSNNKSLVLKYAYKESDFIFTGDIDFSDENLMIKKDINKDAEVLKVAHHGSKYSTGNDFLNNYNFKYAVVSSGKNNVYKHPSNDTLDRLRNNNIDILTTEKDGMIKFITDGDKITTKKLL